MKVENGYLKF